MIGRRLHSKGDVVPVEQSDDGRHWATLLQLLLACLVSALCAGCPATVQYQPNDRLISELGLVQARQRLDEALSRSPFNMCPDLATLSSRLSDYPYLAWR